MIDPIEYFTENVPLRKVINMINTQVATRDDMLEIQKFLSADLLSYTWSPHRIMYAKFLDQVVGLSIKIKKGQGVRKIILPKDELYIPSVILSEKYDLEKALWNAIYLNQVPEIEKVSYRRILTLYKSVLYYIT